MQSFEEVAGFLRQNEIGRRAWLETPYAGEDRFQRRLEEISRLEEKLISPVSDDNAPLSKISWR